ncbi:Fe-S cluster assembly protein HesB [Alteribacter lacisalsi]|uniref:3-hexulose-6-phosphate synthase n=1 Tax=Alteribacter lacisalsi TaxID=2045244 RepID=A0A2W0HGH6_9BACI|nr:3-hexulose-6-phosphate synthase [Alteribacter lacisalsi]PYZ95992.1 Fe-S cluster assembly protein HesB [Alteribacter lacisalsi]
MKIQLALDRLTREECYTILEQTESHIDWIEVGTGVIKEYGMAIVREIKEKYPYKTLVADMKTCDAGRHEALQAFEAGADITTVMAFSADQTIADVLEVARNNEKRVMIDLLGVTDSHRMADLEELGVDLVSLHFGKDMQKKEAMKLDMFSLVEERSGLEVAVAGGISLDSLPDIMHKSPSVVIVGSAVTKAKDKGKVVSTMRGVMDDYENNH